MRRLMDGSIGRSEFLHPASSVGLSSGYSIQQCFTKSTTLSNQTQASSPFWGDTSNQSKLKIRQVHPITVVFVDVKLAVTS